MNELKPAFEKKMAPPFKIGKVVKTHFVSQEFWKCIQPSERKLNTFISFSKVSRKFLLLNKTPPGPMEYKLLLYHSLRSFQVFFYLH
jgi:hypothetical protein